jgi:signal transduction histidine kinase
MDNKIASFMVEQSPVSHTLEWATRKGQEEERERILKLFHDQVSPHLLAAVFSAQMAKEELEAKGLKESETVAKVGDKLVHVIEGLNTVFCSPMPSASSKTIPRI